MEDNHKLYTFIMDYLGGTYISQFSSDSKESAMKLWIESIEIDQIEGFTLQDKKRIISIGFESDDPCAITGLKNVWHFIIKTKKGPGYINFVQTTDN